MSRASHTPSEPPLHAGTARAEPVLGPVLGPALGPASGVATRRLPAGLLSCVLHVIILLALAMFLRAAPRGSGVEEDRDVGIVTVRTTGDAKQYVWEGETTASSQSAAESTTTLQAVAQPQGSALDLPGRLPSGSDLKAADQIGKLPGTETLLTGRTSNSAGGVTAKTQIFGATGTGTRFVYVFDRSASMSGFQGRPLLAAKQQLLQSLQDLGATHQFQIIFYNEYARLFNPRPGQPAQLLFANDQSKKLATRYVQGITAAGNTKHFPALMLALNSGADVIFFLTDAAEPQLTPRELQQIRSRNQRIGATIHAIEFGNGGFSGQTNFLVRLARQNNGNHVYVDLSRLVVN